MERWLPSHPDMLPCDTINHKMARFQRGWVEWTPGLYPSRTLTQLDYATPEETLQLHLQAKEYRGLYGGQPNKVFANYSSRLDLTLPCQANEEANPNR